MLIELSDSDFKRLRRLGNALASDLVPVKEIRQLVADLQGKCENSSGSATNRAKGVKDSRKDHYRNQLKTA